jgi:DNA repair exonuclease SbcCD nuclease subunit
LEAIRIIHTSDLHLDYTLTDYRREVRAIRRAELIEAFNFLVDEAIRAEAKLFVIAGDLLCAESVADTTMGVVRAGFARLMKAGTYVVLVPGEAEEGCGLDALQEVACESNVHLFAGEEWAKFTPFPEFTVYGLRTTGRNAGSAVLANLAIEGPGRHMGVMHGTFSGTPGFEKPLSPVSSEDLSAAGLDYLALGHYHNMVNCSVGRATCWYSGAPAHHGFDTRGERHALLVTFRDQGTRVSPIKVPSRAQRVICVDVTGKSKDQLFARLKSLESEDLCLKVELQGHLDERDASVPRELVEEFSGRFFHLEVVDRTAVGLGRRGRRAERPQGSDLGPPVRAFLRKVTEISSGARSASGAFGDVPASVLARAVKYGLSALGEVRGIENREAGDSGKGQVPPA